MDTYAHTHTVIQSYYYNTTIYFYYYYYYYHYYYILPYTVSMVKQEVM